MKAYTLKEIKKAWSNAYNEDISTIPQPIQDIIESVNSVISPRDLNQKIAKIEIKKLPCESQPDLHKCGDYAVFNALALNQMSDEDFNANKVKDVINLTHQNDSLQRDRDYSGSWVDEYRVSDFCNQNREFLMQNFNSNNSSSNQSSRQKSTPKPSMLCDNLAKNLEKSLIIRNSCDHLNEDSMIATAIAISSIEEDNLKFLNQLKDKIKASGINFDHRVDDDSIKLLDLISSPIIASNLEKFLPILTGIEADPNQIHDHKIFGEFENKIFESQGKNKAQYSQETESLNNVKYYFDKLFNPRSDDPLHGNTPDQLIDSLKQYAQISQSKIQPQEFDALKNIKDLTPLKPLFEEIIRNPDSLNYSSFSINLKNEIYKNTDNKWTSMVRRTSGPSPRLP